MAYGFECVIQIYNWCLLILDSALRSRRRGCAQTPLLGVQGLIFKFIPSVASSVHDFTTHVSRLADCPPEQREQQVFGRRWDIFCTRLCYFNHTKQPFRLAIWRLLHVSNCVLLGKFKQFDLALECRKAMCDNCTWEQVGSMLSQRRL